MHDYSPGHQRLDTPPVPHRPPPWPPGDNMHGAGGKGTVADGYRLWTETDRTVLNQTAPSCVAICASDATCTGVTFSNTTQFGLHSCYLISPPILRVTEEAPFASWTKTSRMPVSSDPSPADPPLEPRAGRVSDPILPYFAVAGTLRALVASVAWSGFWRGDLAWDPAKQAVSVRLGHSRQQLCASLLPGEAMRTLGVATVAVAASELTARVTASIKVRKGFLRTGHKPGWVRAPLFFRRVTCGAGCLGGFDALHAVCFRFGRPRSTRRPGWHGRGSTGTASFCSGTGSRATRGTARSKGR